ncbi:MAG: tetratricopeptide repeat protein [Rhodoferax sp.]
MTLSRTLAACLVAWAALVPTAQAQDALWKSSYTHESAGRYKEALAAIDMLPATGDEAEYKLLRRGWLLYLATQYDEAVREYQQALERNPKSLDARLGLTLPLLAAKRWSEAEKAARAVLEQAPHHYTAALRLVQAQEGQQNWGAMLKSSAALVADYGSDATAYVYLARAHAWLGRRSEAQAAYNAVLVRYPGHQEALGYLNGKK